MASGLRSISFECQFPVSSTISSQCPVSSTKPENRSTYQFPVSSTKPENRSTVIIRLTEVWRA